MIMIPLHYLISLGALFLLLREFAETSGGERNRFLIAFLIMLAVQAAIVGTRFGYGQEWLREIQPVTASILPPLAYLTFRGKANPVRTLPHLLPPVLAVLITWFAIRFLDAFLAANNLFYGFLLVRIGLRGSDGLAWAGLNRARNWLVMLWLIVGLLVYSGITDSVIAIDFFLTDGKNTSLLVGYASGAGMIGTVLAGILVYLRGKNTPPVTDPLQDKENHSVFEKVDAFLNKEKLYLDADLNLNRIARRLVLPARDVSRAINSQTGNNVSQYVNELRIAEACRILKNPEASVTAAIYESGFNTKSNFNREFFRVTGKTPSEWRDQYSGKEAGV